LYKIGTQKNNKILEIKLTKKTYVLDTNVLLSDPGSLFSFDEHNVIIPIAVLEELDNHKSRQDEIGQNARAVSRTLDELREEGSLLEGIGLRNGGNLKVVSIHPQKFIELPLELRSPKPKVDNMIIALMLSLEGEDNAILVSKDINVRLKCDSLGIRCEDYLKMRVASDPRNMYRGVEVVDNLTPEQIDSFYRDGSIWLDEDALDGKKLYPNQIIVLKSKNQFDGKTIKSAIAKCLHPDRPLVHIQKIEQSFNLKPRNKEQNFSLDLLFDENIKLLTLVGPSGTGKTLLAISAALAQLKGLGDTPRYDKLIVTRPVQPLGKDIGFLPGTLEEKMEPWIAPIRDNINFLMGVGRKPSSRRKSHDEAESKSHYLQLFQEKGLIEIEAITFIRGRSIPNAFIIIDEAQNLSMHELKTIVTRVGDNTKIILTGDVEQIDNVHVDAYSNGLTVAVEKFKDYSIAGHVTLIKGERSELATLASQIL
jgi:PhoH-like ATPase